MIVISFCNLKSGVGKTTACQNIAVALAKAGKKTAVVDMDPQSSLSASFGIIPGQTEPQVFDLLSGDASWDDIVVNKEGVDIIPSSLNLALAELNSSSPLKSDDALKNALKKISPDRYDYILLDSPSQLGTFTRNVLAAGDKVIVPIDGGIYSLYGLKLLNSSFDILRERLHDNIEILGVLMTNFNSRLYSAHQIFEDAKKSFEDIIFENYVIQDINLIEAAGSGMSVFEYSPESAAAQCYKNISEELLKKLESVSHHSETEQKIKTETPAEIDSELENEQEIFLTEDAVLVEAENDEEDTGEELKSETIQIQEPVIVPPVHDYKPGITGEYEESIKHALIDMLPDDKKAEWVQMLAPVSDISRDEIDVKLLREDFENSDRNRYTFYIINDEDGVLSHVKYADQIIEPLRCVVKLDEHGAAEVYM